MKGHECEINLQHIPQHCHMWPEWVLNLVPLTPQSEMQSVAFLTEESENQVRYVVRSWTFVDIDHEIFSKVILPLPPNQEGQL